MSRAQLVEMGLQQHEVARLTGVCSVLEHGYLSKVERPHGLSGSRRQVRDRMGAGVVYRDVAYDHGRCVELDGRLFHDTTHQRDRDFQRDLEAAASGRRTIRLSYGQVFARPCTTAGLSLHSSGDLLPDADRAVRRQPGVHDDNVGGCIRTLNETARVVPSVGLGRGGCGVRGSRP